MSPGVPQLLTVVIPVFNECHAVARLMHELIDALAAHSFNCEVIWVDDGSTDGTLNKLKSLVRNHDNARLIALPRRFGQSAALWTGLTAARGSTIVTMDGDGQNDPADIQLLLGALESADMVVGCRRRRCDPLAKRLFAYLANAARNLLTGSQIPDSGCGLKAFTRDVLEFLIPFDGMHRFLPTLAEISDFQVVSRDVNHRPRRSGKSKYGIADRLVWPFFDCVMLWYLRRRRLPSLTWRERQSDVPPARLQNDEPASVSVMH